MGRIEFTGFLACVCGEVGDKIFVNKAENVVVLAVIGRNILDELEQVVDCTALRFRALYLRTNTP